MHKGWFGCRLSPSGQVDIISTVIVVVSPVTGSNASVVFVHLLLVEDLKRKKGKRTDRDRQWER